MTISNTVKNAVVGGVASLLVLGSVSPVVFAKNDKDNDVRANTKVEKKIEKIERQEAAPKLEININNNGKANVHGAKVTSVASSTITAATSLGSYSLTWTVNTNGNTKFIRQSSGKSSFSEIAVGDIISFQGTVDQNNAQLTVLANTIHDWTIQRNSQITTRKNFEGILKSISSSSTPSSLVLSGGSADLTVNVLANTAIVNSFWQFVPLSQFNVGNRLNIFGTIQASSSSTIDATVIRNLSL